MSLPEVLISSLLLASSSSAALGVWSQATATLQQSNSLQQQGDVLQLMQLASHRWLIRHGAEHDLLRSGSAGCSLNPEAVASALNQFVPLPDGVKRQSVDDPQQLGVWLELSVVNVDGQEALLRRQLVSPVAYGFCKS